MKKIVAIFLLLVMVICSSGWYISYRLSLYSIHLQQREIIKKHQDIFKNIILEIGVPGNYAHNKNIDLRFEEEDEIMFNGKMYDVISMYSIGDSIFFKCLPDAGEDEIRELASDEILNGNTKTASQKENTLIKFNPGLFTNFIRQEGYLSLAEKNPDYYLTYIIKKVFAPYQNIPSPPPWQNC